jgi:dipeptide/tripeptide permease
VAAFSKKVEAGEVFTLIGGQADFFLFLFVVPMVVGLVVLALSPIIKKMMHGLH